MASVRFVHSSLLSPCKPDPDWLCSCCSEFIRSLAYGGRLDTFEALPNVSATTSWDGNDAPAIEEEEFSLEELMGDETRSSDEL